MTEKPEREADRLQEQGDRLEREIEETRGDWESKEQDASVPGAQPDPQESDQLPEEGPSGQVPQDEDEGGARDEAERSAGVPDEEETSTGNPDAAGAEDPDE
jgi:TolA-binding protein